MSERRAQRERKYYQQRRTNNHHTFFLLRIPPASTSANFLLIYCSVWCFLFHFNICYFIPVVFYCVYGATIWMAVLANSVPNSTLRHGGNKLTRKNSSNFMLHFSFHLNPSAIIVYALTIALQMMNPSHQPRHPKVLITNPLQGRHKFGQTLYGVNGEVALVRT